MTKKQLPILLAVAVLCVYGSLYAQSGSEISGKPLTYDVVSVKPSKSNAEARWVVTDNQSSANHVSLFMLVRNAFRIRNKSQIIGLPDWGNLPLFDVNAKMDGTTAKYLQSLQGEQQWNERLEMDRAVLRDAFKLKAHYEEREVPVYFLTVSPKGAKLQPAAASEPPLFAESHGKLLAQSTSISELINNFLAYNMDIDRLVIDKTGLSGKYDFTLTWSAMNDQASAEAAPSIFSALQEQLGLKLQPARAKVEVLVIDHVDKPQYD